MANYEAQVRAAPNPKEAMLVIARALDALTSADTRPADSWSTWAPEPATERSAEWRAVAVAHELAGGSTEIIESEDGVVDVVLPTVSADRYDARHRFSTFTLKLSDFLGDGEDWAAAYAKGGPMWLYLGNRELVMSYPDSVKQAMVQDVELDSPQDAQEMARDVLKAACETGPTSAAGTDLMGSSPTAVKP